MGVGGGGGVVLEDSNGGGGDGAFGAGSDGDAERVPRT